MSDQPSRGGRIPRVEFDVLIPDSVFSAIAQRFGRRFITFLIILAVILIPFAYWWFHPPINLRSENMWNFICVCILLPFWVFCFLRSAIARRDVAAGPGRSILLDVDDKIAAARINAQKVAAAEKRSRFWSRLSRVPLLIIAAVLICALISFPIFPGNASRFANIINVETRDFSTDIAEIDYDQIPIIDRVSASLLGNRVMGEIPEYVSQFDVSPLYSQINYQGRPVRVSPLVYEGLIKWFTNRTSGIPAYVLVDMASQEARIVRLEQPIRYSESEPLGRNINRFVQLKYPFYMFGQKSFEIDESGTPWWVCPVLTRRIGLFGGTDVNRVVLCNAYSGECLDLPIEQCPDWVDRTYPTDLLLQQFNWYGAYQKGFINAYLGQEGVVQVTPGTDGMAGYNYLVKDDDVWVYSGITSATPDNSIVGFVLINQRTADARYYPVAGATEVSAMSSAEGQVQQFGYKATFPLLINIHGTPTYFMALKDNHGLVKQFAMISIQHYQYVALGDTVASCQRNYLSMLFEAGVVNTMPDDELPVEGDTVVTTGRVERIATAVIGGNSHFYLTLEGDSAIYDCALPELLSVLQVQPGDTIELTFQDKGDVCVVSRLKVVIP